MFGIILIIMALAAITQIDDAMEEVAILRFFDLTLMAWCIFITALMTIITSALGFVGAWAYKVNMIKVVPFSKPFFFCFFFFLSYNSEAYHHILSYMICFINNTNMSNIIMISFIYCLFKIVYFHPFYGNLLGNGGRNLYP